MRSRFVAVLVLALAVSACSSEEGVTIYGDGSISCPDHRADDQSLPVGKVVFEPSDGEIQVNVTLTAAAPNAPYNVEVWSDESCATDGPLHPQDERRLETDGNGEGELDFVLTELESGTYRLNVNLCCGGRGSEDPEDFRHREMGTSQFTEVVVP